MQRILPIVHELPLLDAARTRALEQQATATLPPHTLMRRAGAAVARLALAIAPHAQRIWVAAGPGNNGGDGLDAAIHLQQHGKDVHVTLFGDAAALPPDAQDALARAKAAGVRIDAQGVPPNDAQLAIDALLGIGANRAPAGPIAEAIRAFNAQACPVLAVDLPSGLNPGTGQAYGDDCVIATHTLALIALAPGLFTGAGRDHAGQVWLDALGIDDGGGAPCAWLSGLTAGIGLAPRRHAQHKGSFGDVAIVGGAPGMGGAALLAARAAHAAGAGRVYVERLDAAAATLDALCPELMVRRGWSAHSAPEVLARTTVACGCGGGDAVRAALPRLLSLSARLVLDADALNAVAADASLAALLHARASRGRATVLTPHPLEAARLLACTAREVQADRLSAARALATRFACIVVLKGSGSVIAAAGEVPCINSTGNASLASAGTGDVLAGWLAGRWAQRGSGDETALAFAAAKQAVAEHGAAAEPPPAGPLRASDLIERLHRR
jgi:ADP-dependent NAD(P)H-hydrate dehydratase / NAD(P)H-hydrate epimerase